jgi:PncC family amidohydrolase
MLPRLVRRSLGDVFAARGESVFVVEAGSGGAIQAHLCAASGASRWFLGGVVCYADVIKTRILNLPAQTLREHGSVSEVTVAQLAQRALELSPADWVLVESGVYGPLGGSPEKPVGRVLIYVASRQGYRQLKVLNVAGDRAALRQHVCVAAEQALYQALVQEKPDANPVNLPEV